LRLPKGVSAWVRLDRRGIGALSALVRWKRKGGGGLKPPPPFRHGVPLHDLGEFGYRAGAGGPVAGLVQIPVDYGIRTLAIRSPPATVPTQSSSPT